MTSIARSVGAAALLLLAVPALAQAPAAPQERKTGPTGGPAVQNSVPSAAPPATTKQTTAATDQPPAVRQMNQEEKDKVEKGGK